MTIRPTVIRPVFICHHQKWREEVHQLADELRLRGVVPWVDVQGGFKIGDHTTTEARRAIREDSFGTIAYATPGVFERPFIRDTEIPTALAAWDDDHRYLLSVVARGQGYDQISADSRLHIGRDLGPFTGRKVGDDPVERQACFGVIGRELLEQSLDRFAPGQPERVAFQFSTRDLLGDEPADLFRVDATRVVTDVTDPDQWVRVERGLRDVKAVVAARYGRPAIAVHGSKHLTAAYLLGATFPSTTAAISIRTRGGDWSSDHVPAPIEMTREVAGGDGPTGNLFLELDAVGHELAGPVDAYIGQTGTVPELRVRLRFADRAVPMTNAAAVTVAVRVREEILDAMRLMPMVRSVYLFAAIPQALAVFIGHRSNALPPIQLHEFVDRQYRTSHRLNSLPDDGLPAEA